MKTFLHLQLIGSIILLTFCACSRVSEKQKDTSYSKDQYLTDKGDTISLDSAAKLTANWRIIDSIAGGRPSMCSAYFVKEADLNRLLSGNQGIRVYFGYKTPACDTLHIVLASVTSAGKDDIRRIPDNFASPCPAICAANDLQPLYPVTDGKALFDTIPWDTATVWTGRYRSHHLLGRCSASTSKKVKGYWIASDVVDSLLRIQGANGLRFYFASPSTTYSDPTYLVMTPAYFNGMHKDSTWDILGNSVYLASDICPDSIYCDSPLAK